MDSFKKGLNTRKMLSTGLVQKQHLEARMSFTEIKDWTYHDYSAEPVMATMGHTMVAHSEDPRMEELVMETMVGQACADFCEKISCIINGISYDAPKVSTTNLALSVRECLNSKICEDEYVVVAGPKNIYILDRYMRENYGKMSPFNIIMSHNLKDVYGHQMTYIVKKSMFLYDIKDVSMRMGFRDLERVMMYKYRIHPRGFSWEGGRMLNNGSLECMDYWNKVGSKDRIFGIMST